MSEYELGENDCIQGISPRSNNSDYLRGYGDQYTREMIEDAKSEHN
jgi:hypothetical protein